MAVVIDLHSHILPGIDDGPPDLEGSLAMARRAEAEGITTIVATPHVSWDHPATTAALVASGVERLNATLAAAGIALTVRTGGEVAMTRAADLADEELAALRLGGGPWLLVECPLTPAAAGLETLLHHLLARGHRIVLAHPERSPALQRDHEQLERLVRSGLLCSVTAGSLTGRFGRTVRDFTHELLRAGLVHNVTSDAHDADRRPPSLRPDLEAAEEELPGLLDLAGWLTDEVPAAVLAGAPIPAQPGPAPGRRRRGILRRASRRR